MHDLVIRNGLLVDGSGAPSRPADVAIDDGRIVEVTGPEQAVAGRREIDADGRLVTPGFVDIHTHYDGQVTWDPEVTPSGWHGVTTIVMGNCGVGFAPAAPDRQDWLIQLMEGVEDIPGTALAEGMSWNWESFPEYLDELDRMPRVIDVAAQVPHGAVRAYVMGERGGGQRGRHRRRTSPPWSVIVRGGASGRRGGVLDHPHGAAPGQGRRAGRGDHRIGGGAAGDRRRPRGRAVPACSRWPAT